MWSPQWDSNPRPFLYEGNALPLSYRGTYAFVPNRPKAADEQCIPRNSTKKAGERLITFNTGPAAGSMRQGGYGVHCIHPANPPEDRECSGQRHTINPIPTAADSTSQCTSTTGQPATHRERNHHDFTPQPPHPAAGRSARRSPGTERMRFQLLPTLRIGICERFGERIRKCYRERFGIRGLLGFCERLGNRR